MVNARHDYGVADYLGDRRYEQSRKDIDDGAAVAGIDHRLAEYLAGQKHAGQVDIQDALPLGFRDLEKWRAGIHTGRIDQDVYMAETLDHTRQRLLQAGLAGCVAADSDSRASQGFDRARK